MFCSPNKCLREICLFVFHKLCVIHAQEQREIWMKQFSRAIITWPWVHWKNKTYKLRGRTFDFLGGYGWLQKKISCRLISRGKILARKYLAKKNSNLEKYLSRSIMLDKMLHHCMSEKKFYLQRFGKNILTQIKAPSSKSQMVGP